MSREELPFSWAPMQVQMERYLGTDLDVVNAARRSFGTRSEWLNEERRLLNPHDQGLLTFLGRGFKTSDYDKLLRDIANAGFDLVCAGEDGTVEDEKQRVKMLADLMWRWRDEAIHDTPFNHVGATFSIMIPVSVARQLVKTEYMPWSEISRRYKDEGFFYWKPGLADGIVWREAPEDKKQGSGGPLPDEVQRAMDMTITTNTLDAHRRLLWALESGACLEQARMLLPANLMVEVTWSGFLGAICKMLRERTGAHAQAETRWVAQRMLLRLESRFPYSVRALVRQ